LVVIVVLYLAACDDARLTFPGNDSPGIDNRELILSFDVDDYIIGRLSFSIDCDKFAFDLCGMRNDIQEMYIYDFTSNKYELLPNTAPSPSLNEWSNNGNWIAYTGGTGLYIIKPDGTGNTCIYGDDGAPGVGAIGGTWSPDDTEIFFVAMAESEDEPWDAYLMVADLSDLNDIKYRIIGAPGKPGGYWDYEFPSTRWNPGGGEYIAFTRYSPPELIIGEGESLLEVMVTNPYGEFYETLIPDQGDWRPFLEGWSPDGRYLLLSIISNDYDELWAYELKTGKFTQITSSPQRQYSLGPADWGNNGKIIFKVFDFITNKGEIYLIDAPY